MTSASVPCTTTCRGLAGKQVCLPAPAYWWILKSSLRCLLKPPSRATEVLGRTLCRQSNKVTCCCSRLLAAVPHIGYIDLKDLLMVQLIRSN